MKPVVDTYCGLSCEACEFRKSMNCGGCIATKGKLFHGGCEVADCAIERKRNFCGDCGDFPCELLKRYSFDPEHGDNGERIERCREIKRALVAEARDGLDLLAYCGFHCDYCDYSPFCGGCRSDYNGCSFATLFEDGRCPNEVCCKEKGHYGCWECDELEGCEKGFFSKKDEYLAKASSLFIQKHGRDEYMRMLANVKEKDGNYPRSIDKGESVEATLKQMESFI